jgi:hypothetical protein
MPLTYTLIESATVGSGGVAAVTFGTGGTIPQTYTDLRILMTARLVANGDTFGNVLISFNGGPSGAVSSSQFLVGGAGSSVGNVSNAGQTAITNNYGIVGSIATASVFSVNDIYIPSYTSTTKPKFVLGDNVGENNDASEGRRNLLHGVWNPATQAAITSIVLTANYNPSELFAQHSTFYLYGIKKN